MADPLIFGSVCIESEEKVRQLNVFRFVHSHGIVLDNPKSYNSFAPPGSFTYSRAKKLWPLIIDEIEAREKIEIEQDLKRYAEIMSANEKLNKKNKKPSIWVWITLKF